MSSPPPSTYPLSRATTSDIPQMALAYTSAFASDPLLPYTLPPTIPLAAYEHWLDKRLRVAFDKPSVEHWKITDPETGNLVAWCRWEFPRVLTREQEEEEREKEVKVELPEGAGVEIWGELTGGIERMRERYYVRGEMHLAHFLVVHQDYQRRGLGAKLLRHGLAIADAANQKVLIEATVAGTPLYSKLGWRIVDAITYDLTKYGGTGTAAHQIMVREPGGKVSD